MPATIEARGTVIAVFNSVVNAQNAISHLKRDGFTDAHLGVAVPMQDPPTTFTDGAATTAVAGAAAGLGTGALWGLAIVSGILPGIGPALIGGTLAAVLSSAAVGAGAVGLAGALIGLGFTTEEADYLQGEFEAGKVVMTAKAGDQTETVRALLEHDQRIDAGALTPSV